MGRAFDVVVGIVCIVAGICWTLFWGALALAESTFGGSTWGWVLVIACIGLGVSVFVFGLRLMAGVQHMHPPTRI